MVVIKSSTSNDDEVTLIACGLDSILDQDIPRATRVINFHGNQIRRIEGLSSVALGQNLRLLDLSSNQISFIENLDALVSLRFLNLAANLIPVVDSGLENLRSLECLNLSFNQITSINGLRCFTNEDTKLNTLMLHGNRLNQLSSVLPIVKSLKSVRTLSFEIDGATNPLCRDRNYMSLIWTHCPHLSTLDGMTADGVSGEAGVGITEEAELAGLLGFLTSDDDDLPEGLNDTSSSEAFRSLADETTSGSSDTQLNIVRETYPKIEAALNQFRKNPGDADRSADGSKVVEGKRDGEERPTSERPCDPDHPSGVDETRLANIEKQLQQLHRGQRATMGETPRLPLSQVQAPPQTQLPPPSGASTANVDEGTQTDAAKSQEIRPGGKDVGERDDAYLRNLLSQLDEEREKRWTAQKKYDDLSINFNEVNEKRAQERKQIEEALTLVRRLQARLDSGKASQRDLERNVDSLTDAHEKVERDLKSSKQREAALQRLLKELQEKGNRQNRDKDGRIKAVEEELEVVSREAKLATAEAEKYKTEVDQLKSLLAEKEKDHRESLNGKYSIGSAEIQTLLTKEGDRISDTYKMQVDMWRRKYQDLEDEFRLALHLEADRFSTLQNAEEKLRREYGKLNASLSDLVNKEARASALVKELSDLAKEQKSKMSETSKNHQNSLNSLKKRCEVSEGALSTAKERLKAMDEITTAKAQLETKCAALETLAKNIKAEKELWSGELAQQGAALSQDRGRLEAKVEALAAEVASLKKQLERDADSLRIKNKVIDDQTETITKLKDGLLERDRRVKEANEEHVTKEKESNRRLEEEVQNRLAAEETIEYLEGRKEQLKAEMAALEEESANLKANNEKLVQKWKGRSKLIESLEVKVTEMKRSWDEKEETLTRERDAAVAEKEETRAKSAAIDAAFRSQLDQAQAAHARALAELEALKNLEIEETNSQLLAAEDEMRDILKEAADHKAQMQRKIKNLTSAFAELQN